MALQVWLPLTNTNNIGESDLAFSLSGNAAVSNYGGKTNNNCYRGTAFSSNCMVSNKKISLGNKLSMSCWCKFNSLNADSSLGASLVSQHRYPSNTGMGITIKYVSSTTGYISCNTGNGSSRTYNTYCGNTLLSAGNWYHLVMTYDGTNIRLYVNGKLDGAHAYSGQSNIEDYIIIGGWSFDSSNTSSNGVYNNYELNGYLNDVRVYNHVLSNVEVRNLARALVSHYDFENIYSPVEYLQSNGNQWFDTGATIGTNTWIKTKLSYTSAFGYNMMYGAWAIFSNSLRAVDGLCLASGGTSTQNLGITIGASQIYEIIHTASYFSLNGNQTSFGSGSNTSGTGRNILMFAASNSGNTPYSWSSYGQGKIYYFQIYDGSTLVRDFIPVRRTTDGKLGMLDKVNNVFYTNSGSGDFTTSTASISGKVLDCSGNGVDGTTSNISITNDVKIGTQGVTFNGASSKIDSTILLTTNMTFACWVKFSGNAGYHIIDCRATSGETGLQPMYGGTAYGLQCYSSAGGSYTWSAATCGFTTGTWYHLVVTITSSNATLYINGVSKGTQSGSFGSNFGDRLCRLGSRCTGANWFSGAMCDVRVYNTTLSANDVKELYEVRGMIDDKGNAYCDGIASATDFNLSNTGVIKSQFFANKDYELLEYIQATGTQYIKTGVVGGAIWEYDIQYTDTSTRQLMGHGGSGGEYWGTTSGKYGKATWSTSSVPTGNRDIFRVENVSGGGAVYINGTYAYNNGYDSRSEQSEAQIFAISGSYLASCKLWECRVWQSNVMVRHFIPAKRNSDKVVGLLDIINNKFYTNSGSGTFGYASARNKFEIYSNTLISNNFYQDGGACVAKYELTQFARYSTYTLSISAGSNTTVTVNRTSSPNAGASTGNLSNGANIYTGDTLTISYSVSSGYNISTHTVNGTTFTSGTSYTVSGNISVVTTAVASTSWHTVFSGSQTYNFNANSYGNTTITLSGLRANVSTKITGKVYKDADLSASGFGSGWWGQPTEYTFSDTSTPYSKTGVYQYASSKVLITISTPTSANTFPIYRDWGDDGGVVAGCSKLIITKVEQYY